MNVVRAENKYEQVMSYPITRPRRLRRTSALRALVRETELSMGDLIAPLFVVSGSGIKRAIGSLPGHDHLSVDMVAEEALALSKIGVKGVLLFGLPETKDPLGSSACDERGVVQQATRAIKRELPDLLVIADLCFCEYTSHGHCGVLLNGEVDNDLTLVETRKQALSLAQAGVDIIAPSGMMDGVVGAIRSCLDEAGYQQTVIMAYSAKYASSFYGPFREAADSAPSHGDRQGYQMDPANTEEALREIALDLEEGADIVMVKPALSYLDVISRAKQQFRVPLAAYNVSGEYAMVKAAAGQGLIDHDRMMLEILTSIRRAGADLVITYFAKDAARFLRHN